MSTPAFATLATLEQFFSADEMTQLQTGGVSATALLASVNAEIESYLSPLIGTAVLLSVPLGIQVKAADMVRYYLNKDVAGVETAAYLRWKEAIRYLERVAEGKTPLKLDLADDPDTPGDDTESMGVWSEPGTALSASEWRYL